MQARDVAGDVRQAFRAKAVATQRGRAAFGRYTELPKSG